MFESGRCRIHVVLGFIFLKYISEAFTEHPKRDQDTDPEHSDEYRAHKTFWVPLVARWSYLRAQAKQATIGQLVNEAMEAIEWDNPARKEGLAKDYVRPATQNVRLGQLMDVVSNADLRQLSPRFAGHSPPIGREEGGGGHNRGQVLFIDARKMGQMVDPPHPELSDEDIAEMPLPTTPGAGRKCRARPGRAGPLQERHA